MSKRTRRTSRTVAGIVVAALIVTACTPIGEEEPAVLGWVAPLWPDGPTSVDEICNDGTCVAEAVALPWLRPIEPVVDLPLPETLGALTVERLWTGERGGLFGPGWETIWDTRLSDGTITGPLPAALVTAPTLDVPLSLADGSSVRFDPAGRLVGVCRDAAYCVGAEWGDDRLVLRSESRNAGDVQFRLVDGVVDRVVAADGRVVTYGYSDGFLTEVTTTGLNIEYSYDEGRLAAIDDGSRRSFTYDGAGRVESVEDRDGSTWRLGRGIKETVLVRPPDAALRTFRFSGAQLVELHDDELGVLLRREVEDGIVRVEERPLDGVRMTRQVDGTIEVTEARPGLPDRRVVLRLDALGRVVEATSPDGVTTLRYDGSSPRPAVVTQGDGSTVLTYDGRGLLTATRDPDGYEVTIERGATGLPERITDGVLATAFEYDAAGRTIRETSGDWSSSAEYRSDGLLGSITTRSGTQLEAGYDDAGRLRVLGAEEASGAIPGLSDADLSGSAASALLEVDNITERADGVEYRYDSGETAVYDEWGRLVVITVDGRTTSRTYHADGRLTQLVEPDGTTYAITYTPAGRIASIDDGSVEASLTWHGDLLTSISSSGGTTITYAYQSDGQLTDATMGAARWRYGYDDAGLLTEIDRPTGEARYEWDDSGRPIRAVDGNLETEYTWSGDGYDLETVDASDSQITIERDGSGRTVGVAADGERSTFVYDDDGAIESYQLPSGVSASIRYEDGLPVELTADGRTERWDWDDGVVSRVTMGDDHYDLEWAAPGILAAVRQGETSLLDSERDELGRILAIRDGDGDSIASFDWTSAGVARVGLDDHEVSVGHDVEQRATELAIGDTTYSWSYRQGALLNTSADGTTTSFDYDDGRVSQTRVVKDDAWANIGWDTGRPVSFRTSEGDGSFVYRGDHVAAIKYDDHVREVSYDEDGSPSAEATGGDFLKDLFDEQGRFAQPASTPVNMPTVPWLERLPSELGLELPTVVSATDVVAEALDTALPQVPLPLRPDDRIAERTAESVAALVVPASLPIAVDRMASVTITPGGDPLESLLTSSAPVVVASSVFDQLADGPCLLCRLVGAGAAVGHAIAGAGKSVSGFLTNNPVGQALMTAGFMVASFFTGAFCVGSVVCAVAVAAGYALVAIAITAPTVGLRTAIVNETIRPFQDLVSGLIRLEPVAVLTAVALVTSYALGARSTSTSASVRSRALTPVCNMRRIVCVSSSRFGAAADHVADAQRGGAARLLRIDRNGASARRDSALRNIPTRVGFDRDEYPFAISSRRAGLSIRYIDPASNRGLGAYLRSQLAGLPDGARFFVLPTS